MSGLCVFGDLWLQTNRTNVPIWEAKLHDIIPLKGMDFGGKRMPKSIQNRARGVSRRMLQKDDLKRTSQHLVGTSPERFRTPRGVSWGIPGALLGASGACWQRPGASWSVPERCGIAPDHLGGVPETSRPILA